LLDRWWIFSCQCQSGKTFKSLGKDLLKYIKVALEPIPMQHFKKSTKVMPKPIPGQDL